MITRKELLELANKEVNIDCSLVDAYLQGAETMRDECFEEVQELSDCLMQAHDSEDWQGVAHVALDIIPRLFKIGR